MNPAPAPEGILDPQQPYWPADRVGEATWLRLKGKLTGRKIPELSGEQHTSYVKLSDADADRLIENLKKWGKYPQVNQNDKYGGAYNNEAYQKWLVEEFLEKPFREEVDKKIEEAQQESRIKEIRDKAKKDKESVPLPPIQEEKKEQDILDSDQEAIEEQVEKITTELDSVEEEEKKAETPETPETPETTEEKEDSNKLDSDIQAISDSLVTIKESLTNQISDLGSIERDSVKSLSVLEELKQLFQAQTDIVKRELDKSESKERESSLEKSEVVSGNDQATSTTGDNKAEGIIQGVDGPTITVKTTEGEFKQGQKISQGGGGGGLFDMLKGIAGKFMGRGKGAGGGGAPLKMSRGGIAVGPTKLAGGALSPGVYDKPTRGNLAPGQAVVPLNRNIGKKMFPDHLNQTTKLQQPLADVMAQPLKAIGLSILTVAGNFLRLLGPLAGFFTPYVSGLVKGFAAVLGVPVAIISALLGGPAYAAMEDQEKQQNVFSGVWGSLMEKFGFDFGGEDDQDKKKRKKKGDTPSTTPGEWGPLLDLIKSVEAKAHKYEAVNYGKGSGVIKGITDMTITEAYKASEKYRAQHGGSGAVGQYQFMTPTKQAKDAGLNPDTDKFSPENQDKMAVDLIENKRGGKDWKAGKLDDNTFMKNVAAEWRGLPAGPDGKTYQDQYASRNAAHATWDKYKEAIQKIKAEEGVKIITNDTSSMGKMLGWSVVSGPNSGYDVGSNLEMHGEEAYLQYEKGFSILPIENNQFSLSKKPKETLTRWQELLGPPAITTGPGPGEKNQYKAERGITAGQNNNVSGFLGFLQKKLFGPRSIDRKRQGRELRSFRNSKRNFGKDYKRQELMLSARAKGGSGLADIRGAQREKPAPRNPVARTGGSSKPAPAEKKAPSETDLMMEQYEALVAAGKHGEAKELGMKIWNKTWRKTEKGIERIPTTPLTATDAPASKPPPPATAPGGEAQEIIVPIPQGGGVPPAPQPQRTMKEEMEYLMLKNLC